MEGSWDRGARRGGKKTSREGRREKRRREGGSKGDKWVERHGGIRGEGGSE